MVKKLLMAFLIFNLVGCASLDEVDQSDVHVKTKAEQFVKDHLKIRTKVEFPSKDINIYNDDSDSWTVIGYVDTENEFGTEIRTKYTVNMTYFPETQTWKLDKISFSDKSVEKQIPS